jgi:hypothetical protein
MRIEMFSVLIVEDEMLVCPPEFYISAARSMLSCEQTGALVININVQYFSLIYSNSSNTQQGRTYIINDAGKVISSLDSALLGKRVDTLQHMRS